MPLKRVLSRDDYTVGWVTAFPLELAAATAMLDEEHKRPSNFNQPSTDHNTYTWGCIEEHNIVLASLPAGVYGTVSAATVASSLLSSFPQVRVGLLVGIGAGIPRPGYDIRLGDVVVSEPSGQSGGVIQYDLGKAIVGDHFQRKRSLNMPPQVLLTALATLKARHERESSRVPQILGQMLKNKPLMARPKDGKHGYVYQGKKNDCLFDSNYQHLGGPNCEECDPCKTEPREPRTSPRPRIHYGIIASGNTLIKDSSTRNSIVQRLDEDCICFEMEASGLMNNFPCIVIRGICDYADSHKNDRWQRRAAAAAAAYAKELLSVAPKVSVLVTRRTLTKEEKKVLILESLKIDVMDERYSGVSKEAENTFRWIFEDTSQNEISGPLRKIGFEPDTNREVSLKAWLTSGARMFHICGKLGTGKSTLMKYIWDNSQTAQSLQVWAQGRQQQLITAQFFFWRLGHPRQKSFAGLARSLLAQILRQCPEMIDVLFPTKLDSAAHSLPNDRFDITISDNEASDAFNRLIHDETICSTYCFCFFIDGLDEFEEKHRTYTNLVQTLNDWASGGSIKLCVSSRELDVFESYLAVSRRIKLQDFTRKDIEALVHQTLNNHAHFQRLRDRHPWSCELLLERITQMAEGIFLWVVLALKLLSEGLENRYSVDDLSKTLRDIPKDMEDLFQLMLNSIPKSQQPKSFCMLSIFAKLYELRIRPLTLLMASFISNYFQDSAFAEKLGVQEMSDQEVKERLVESKAQWIGRCKGLIEVRRDLGSSDARDGDQLQFTHRSIADYLHEHGGHLGDKEFGDPFMKSCLAVIKTAPFRDRGSFWDRRYNEIKSLLLLLRSYPKASQLRYFPALQHIDTALQEREAILSPKFSRLQQVYSPSVGLYGHRGYLSLLHIACNALFYEYVQWKFKYTPASHPMGDMERAEYLDGAYAGMILEDNLTRARETLRVLLQGWDPDRTEAMPIVRLWSRALTRGVFQPGSSEAWVHVEAFLESGIYHPEWIFKYSVTAVPTLTIKYYRNREIHISVKSRKRIESLPPCLRQEGGRAGLQDWVEFVKPENADAILELLKKPRYRPVQRPCNPHEVIPPSSGIRVTVLTLKPRHEAVDEGRARFSGYSLGWGITSQNPSKTMSAGHAIALSYCTNYCSPRCSLTGLRLNLFLEQLKNSPCFCEEPAA